jgi:Ser/Thr protein kinase RdoA (MazF antagonist)
MGTGCAGSSGPKRDSGGGGDRRPAWELLSLIDQPEGQRWVVLFTYAEGEQGNEHMEQQARAFGLATAALHLASEDFSSRSERFHLDLAHLIEKPLAVTLPFLERRPDDQHYLQQFAAKVRNQITAVQGQLDFGFCHGDLHGFNAAFEPNGKVTMFDFDCGGPGWRSCDIAVYRWSSALRSKESNWKIFLDAYQERGSLRAIDLQAIPLFVAARYIWILGLQCGNAPISGSSGLNDFYFDYWLKFIREWDAKQLERPRR